MKNRSSSLSIWGSEKSLFKTMTLWVEQSDRPLCRGLWRPWEIRCAHALGVSWVVLYQSQHSKIQSVRERQRINKKQLEFAWRQLLTNVTKSETWSRCFNSHLALSSWLLLKSALFLIEFKPTANNGGKLPLNSTICMPSTSRTAPQKASRLAIWSRNPK